MVGGAELGALGSWATHEKLVVLANVVDLSIPGEDFMTRSRAEDEACPNASIAVAVPSNGQLGGFGTAEGSS
jgi:hypothetical protein